MMLWTVGFLQMCQYFTFRGMLHCCEAFVKTNVASSKNITRLQRTISQLAKAVQLRSADTGQESWLA